MKLSVISEHKDVGYEGENLENDVKGHKINECSDNDSQRKYEEDEPHMDIPFVKINEK